MDKTIVTPRLMTIFQEIRFREEHLHCFSAASFDFNPLHLSESYARRTPAGERVVYGVLGFLSCLGALKPPQDMIASEVRIDFKSPLVLGVGYAISVEQQTLEVARVILRDGSAVMMRAKLQFRSGRPTTVDLPGVGAAPLRKPRRLEASDLEAKPSFHGTYVPTESAYAELMTLLGIDRNAWGDELPIAALCSSYLTGMELPGERATYSALRLKVLTVQAEPPFAFEIALDSFDEKFGLAQSKLALGGAKGIWATGAISAITRSSRVGVAIPGVETSAAGFTGKTAVIVGASRGLGAAMALQLVAQGGTVVGVYSRSREDADRLVEISSPLPGRLIMECGDASDPNWCVELRNRISEQYGGLDLLVCNAAPALQSLRVEPECCSRIQAYLIKGFALVAAPLSSFLGLVSASAGRVLLVSSSAVDDPPAVWPHYVALKAAAEGLVRTAAAANPKATFWIARPGSMLTDFSDTPLGRLEAEPPEAVARRILEQACGQAPSSTVRFCR